MRNSYGFDTESYNKPVIIIPAYNPSQEFLPFITELHERCVQEAVAILLVNDGCDVSYDHVLEMAISFSNVSIVKHETNLGKGAALKTGISAVKNIFPKCAGVVTADADGQHRVEDIFNVLNFNAAKDDALILGVRHFDQDVPIRSKLGNVLTRAVFYMLTSIRIEDTQTGLRRIPRNHFGAMLDIKSTGYAFEMEMLLWAKQSDVQLETQVIKTVYIDHNATSHFRPFVDSVKIYAVLLKQAFASTATAIVDLCAFSIFFALSGGMLFWANAFSRTVAFPVYFYMNRDFVFKQKQLGLHPVPKLVLAIIVSGLFSYSLQWLAQKTLGFNEVLSKLVIETIVFFINFIVLRDFVYKNKRG